MSKFKTSIPVDVSQITNLLPARASVLEIRFEGSAITVEWDDDDLVTPYMYALDFTVEQLQWVNLNGSLAELPEHTKFRPGSVHTNVPEVKPAPTPEEKELAPRKKRAST